MYLEQPQVKVKLDKIKNNLKLTNLAWFLFDQNEWILIKKALIKFNNFLDESN